MALSDAWLKANNGKARDKTEVKTDRDGLSARVSPKGKIVYQMRYRYNGMPKRLDIGSYPLMGLKKAREESQRLRAELEQGHDPKIVRQLEKQSIIEADSLKDLFRQWYNNSCMHNKTGHAQILRSFELYIFPKIGNLPAGKITLHEWLSILESLAKTKPSIAERLLINAKQMYKWAVKRLLVDSNPLADINASSDLQVKKRAGTRSLSDEEIHWLWMPLQHSRMTPKNKLFLKLSLVYGCRNGEMRVSEKSHFDLKNGEWIVPPENHKIGKKTGKPLVRPITPEIEPLIKEAISLSGRGKHLFTNAGSSEAMGRSAPLALPYNVMQWLRRHKEIEMKHWSVHDLRKTARTNFSTLTEPHIAEIMLGHKLPGHWQTYDHHDYLEEQSAAYSAWCQRLMKIIGSDALL